MESLLKIDSKEIFKYFEEICSIPHGSGNMEKISEYVLSFAEKNGLRAIRDDAFNVIVYKAASKGYENAEPVILQGHLDMVCQKADGVDINFEEQGITPFIDGDYIKAKGTTLGADNGIAVSMIMAILADKNISHPPIEAVFTTDEEIGMLGAEELDVGLLSAKRMINLDSEEADTMTVSCAGGSDFRMELAITKKQVSGTKLIVEVCGLKGGHSGVEIDKCRQNANTLMGRILNFAKEKAEFSIMNINGGTKSNAIPRNSKVELVCENAEELISILRLYEEKVKTEIKNPEEDFTLKIESIEKGSFEAFGDDTREKLVNILLLTPNGVLQMSAEIENLVETSLNLGILANENGKIVMQYALRSNKQSALDYLEEKMIAFSKLFTADFKISGRYSPWEFKENSKLREVYKEAYRHEFSKDVKVSAIHAGLECAVFAKKISDLDCISIGPDMWGVHTVEETLSVSSVERVFRTVCTTLASLK
ncbi:MAG: aminoacyl-histidine dipeptidase [Oscillospiraceae bacterium]|nr:aminoacyl-histidine dipeptidase [Oscillospiraceae bacterium]